MSELSFHPLLPAKPSASSFLQEIRLTDSARVVGRAVWHAPEGQNGAVQIVHLLVDSNWRRRDMGSRLLQAIVEQATAHHQLRNLRLRRVWACVEQKNQVLARAFLTRHGFHHVSTIERLLEDQDGLIYVKSLD